MAQATTTVIMPRRGFLTRALGFTAAGATLALPIITVESAKARIEHHAKALETAMRDYYSGSDVRFSANWHTPEQVREWDSPAHYQFVAMPPVPADHRERFSSWYENRHAEVTGRL